jgi:hypothetical protein
MAPTGVPGEDLVDEGLADLSAGRVTPAALLVSMGAPRLRRLGLVVFPSRFRSRNTGCIAFLPRAMATPPTHATTRWCGGS